MLERSGAVRRGHFLLTSGLHSDLFVLCAQVTQFPPLTARLAEAMAHPYRDQKVDVVAGPAVGGIILAYEVARVLGARVIFAEKTGTKAGGSGGMTLRRGFALRPGERVLVVEDALTTGGSIRKVMDVVRAAGAEIVGVSVLVDRSGRNADLGVPMHSLLTLNANVWDAAHCPLCREGTPLVQPKGSG